MSLYSPIFRSLDQEIKVLQRRIELRRSLIGEREEALRSQFVASLTSPRAFALAVALGFVLGRSERRAADSSPPRKRGFGWIGGIAIGLLQLRYGSPYQWVARLMTYRPRQ